MTNMSSRNFSLRRAMIWLLAALLVFGLLPEPITYGTQAQTYTLRFDANGGTAAPAAESADSASGCATFTIPSGTPSKSGASFQGWAVTSQGAAAYQPGDSISVADSTTLYAVWATPTKTETVDYEPVAGADQKPFQNEHVILHKTAVADANTDNEFIVTLSVDTIEKKTTTDIRKAVDQYLASAEFYYIRSSSAAEPGQIYSENELANDLEKTNSNKKHAFVELQNEAGTVLGSYDLGADCNRVTLFLKIKDTDRYLCVGKSVTFENADKPAQKTQPKISDENLDELMTVVYETERQEVSSSVTLSKVEDTMGLPFVRFVNEISKNGELAVSGQTLEWTIRAQNVPGEVATKTSGNTTEVTITKTGVALLKYRVRLENQQNGFEYDHDYKANQSATLYYSVNGTAQTDDFPIPEIKVVKHSSVSGNDQTYQLIYDANGGNGAPEKQSDTNGQGYAAFPISGTQPTREGYHFMGWSETANAAGADWRSGGSITVTKPETTLYAVWQKQNLVVDFSMKCLIATGVKAYEADTDAGTFVQEQDKLYFIPAFAANDAGIFDLAAMSRVISVNLTSLKDAAATVLVLPANNIYFDDDMQSVETNLTNDETVYGFSNDTSSAASTGAEAVVKEGEGKKNLIFNFIGSRIDVYCTTNSDAKTVTVSIFRNGTLTLENRVVSEIVSNTSAETRYNVPTLSYDLAKLDESYSAGTMYQLRITCSANSVYQLDAVRVYDPMGGNADAEKIYAADGEQNARFLELREQLLNDGETVSLTGEFPTGALYIEDAENTNVSTAETLEAYEAAGPKNEVYLKAGSALAFEIENLPAGSKVMIGLSAPETGDGAVKVNNRPISVGTVVDQYYEILPSDGKVVLTNSGSSMIAITNLKITGGAADGANNALRLTVSRALLRYAADLNTETELTAEPTAEPTVEPSDDPSPTPSLISVIKQLIGSFARALFGSVSRLFGK